MQPGFYEELEAKTKRFIDRVLAHTQAKGYAFNMFHKGSVFWLAFSDKVAIRKSSEIDADSMKYFTTLHASLLEQGVYLGPSGYEVGFVSAAHTDADLEFAADAFIQGLDLAFSTE